MDETVLPENGGVWGFRPAAAAAGFKSPNYFKKIVQNDPTAVFIYALFRFNDCGDLLVTSVNSVPPNTEFVLVSNQSSLSSWGWDYRKYQYSRQLERAGVAAYRNSDASSKHAY